MRRSLLRSALAVLMLGGFASAVEAALLWEQRLYKGDGMRATATDVLVTPSGDYAVAGWVEGPSPLGLRAVVTLRASLDGAERWTHFVDPAPFDRSDAIVEQLPGGDLIVSALLVTPTSAARALRLTRLALADGAVVWQRDFGPFGDVLVSRAGLDATPDGAVVMGFTRDDAPGVFTVARLDGATGADAWSRDLPAPSGAIVVDPAGDVVLVGRALSGLELFMTRVRKLDGATGGDLWDVPASLEMESREGDAPWAIADGAGDILIPGGNRHTTMTLLKLSGASGAEIYRRDTGRPGYAYGIALTPEQDAVLLVAQEPTGNLGVMRVAGEDGAEQWFTPYEYVSLHGHALRVAVDAAGGVVVAGVSGTNVTPRWTVVKLDAADGHEEWRQLLRDEKGFPETQADVAVDPAGFVAAVGIGVFDDPVPPLVAVKLYDPTAPDVGPECAPAPLAGCRQQTIPRSGSLRLLDRPGGTVGDQIVWKWTRGQATTLADLGQPVLRDGLTFCLYDATDAVLYAAKARGGATGPNKSFWKASASSVSFKESARGPTGLEKVAIKLGPDGRPSISLQQKGRVGDPPFPDLSSLALPLRAQLVSDTGTCFESTFTAAGVSRSDAGTFIGKTD